MSTSIEARLEQVEAKIDRLLAAINGRPGEVLTLSQAAAYLGYSRYHLRHLAVDKGLIDYQQSGPGGKLKFRKEDLDAFGHRKARKKSSLGRKRRSAEVSTW